MRARTLGIGAAALVAVAAAGTGGALIGRHGGAAAAATTLPPTSTTAVTRTDLSTTEQVSGTLEYTGSHQVSCLAHGILTGLAAAGTTVSRGQTLFEVDGSPVVLMYGSRPMWRTLTSGVSGPDVTELDDNLIALGYATRAELGTGDTYTSAETAAVKRWQAALGVDQTGTVALGAVDVLPGAIRIATHSVEVGAAVNPGMAVTTATDTTRAVDVPLDVSKQALVSVGDAVSVTLPTGAPVSGTVSHIASVAQSASGGGGNNNGNSATIDVTVTIPDQSTLGRLDQAPVDVTISTQSVHGVLAVPITALTVLPDGGYAIDVVQGGRLHRVPVTTGLFSNSMVEVTGSGLSEGDQVEVPSL